MENVDLSASCSISQFDDISGFAETLSDARLRSYRETPHDVREHYEIEESVLAGGYGYRQLFELVQNAADAILEEIERTGEPPQTAKVHIYLGEERIFAANTGAPLSRDGIQALLNAYSSPKRGLQIGRFGLGFKSLLRFGGTIEILSQTASIRFDPEACRERIRAELDLRPDAPAPGMRLATTIDRVGKINADSDFADLSWASTIVVAEIKNAGLRDRLVEEIRNFPREFLLFLPTDIELLFDIGDGKSTYLTRRHDGVDLVISDGSSESRWRVFEHTVVVDDDGAIDDATHVHIRERVPVAWAVPIAHRDESAGRFWAFFPTDSATRLSGILNAPWKLNSDRTGIIRGAWNFYLMKKAAELVTDSLPSLINNDDPARALDSFPRELDRQGEIAAPVVNAVWANLLSASVIPDANGNLQRPADLNLHPCDDSALVREWAEIADKNPRSKLVHPKCFERDRLARLRTLAARLHNEDDGNQVQTAIDDNENNGSSRRLKPISYAEWFSLVVQYKVDAHKKTLCLAEAVLETLPTYERRVQLSKLEIVPVVGGSFVIPGKAVLAPPDKPVPGRKCVDPDFAADPECYRIMAEVLGVSSLGDETWVLELTKLLETKAHDEFWESFRSAPASAQTVLLRNPSHKIRVRCADGDWHDYRETLRPGDIVSIEDTGEYELGSVILDEDYHLKDLDSLKELGVEALPPSEWAEVRYSYPEWNTFARKAVSDYNHAIGCWYYGLLTTNQRPNGSYLQPLEPFLMPRGWSLLSALTKKPRARLTKHLLDVINRNAERLGRIDYGHTTRGDVYPTRQTPHPLCWLLEQHGVIECGEKTVPLATLRMARHDYAEVIAAIPGWENISHAIDICLVGWPDGLPLNTIGLDPLWPALLVLVLAEPLSLDQIKLIYGLATKNGTLPDEVFTECGSVALENVYITTSHELVRRAVDRGIPALSIDFETLEVWVDAGAKRLEDLLKPTWVGEEGPAVQLLEMFPEIAPVLIEDAADRLYAQACEHLQLDRAGTTSPIPCFAQQRILLVDSTALAAMPFRERLNVVLQEVCAAGWGDRPSAEALRLILSDGASARRLKVSERPNLAERVLASVGGRAEVLDGTFDESVSRALGKELPDHQVASLALAIHGPTLLYLLQESLEEEGLEPPKRWGTLEAEQFVLELGFPSSFATSPQERHAPELIVSGPLRLAPLHDFQSEILTEIDTLLKSKNTRRRAVVSLPTGGGKTRVIVEAAVRLVLTSSGSKRSVLWLAQTNELCEQAVQCFRQVWSNLGNEGSDLRIARLWGGSPSPREPTTEEPFVAVASIQTLNNRFDDGSLAWLSRPSLVVVDECHHAIAPSYTRLLRWLDAALGDQQRDDVIEPIIIGLSATPFRGYNDDESNRLAARFDRLWLPRDQSDLYNMLRSRGVLAKPDYKELQYKSDFQFTEEERKEIKRFGEFPETAAERLATDEARNDVIIKGIIESSCKAVLLFANSVEHARYLAARLFLSGVPASAISGETERSARSYFIQSFHRGEIRVLCNHSVLTTGFDAPKTDMIVISRPVFSPVRYMQMVGRGLRGPENGGTSSCTILTVLDNLAEFQDRIVFQYCERFFQ